MPILSMRDGGDFLLIEDWRSGERRLYELDRRERSVYLAIAEAQHVDRIARHTGLAPSWVEGALRAFDEERIAYFREDRALALALREAHQH